MPNFAHLVKPIDLAIVNSDMAEITSALLGLLLAAYATAGPRAHITVVLTLQHPELFKTKLAVLFVLRRTDLARLLLNCRVQGVYLVFFFVVEPLLLHLFHLFLVERV